MKTIDKIPTGKLGRASKMLKTGLKVGKNYAGYYGSKLLGDADKESLDQKMLQISWIAYRNLKGEVSRLLRC